MDHAKSRDGVTISSAAEASPKFAFIGVRACELHAIAIQDRVFLEGPYPISRIRAAAGCIHCCRQLRAGGGTCFCVSMGTGPKAEAGFDLALDRTCSTATAINSWSRSAARRARTCSAELPHRPATDEAIASAAEAVVARTASQMGRTSETDGHQGAAAGNLEHPRWDEVAERCLTCGNCTMVCPTCFCTTVEDHSDLSGDVRRAGAQVGFLLHHGFLLHPRRQRARSRQARATGNG